MTSYTPSFSLTGTSALVTGASGGLGLHFAHVLHAAGARVALAARRRDKIEEAASSLGESAVAVAMDVTDESSVAQAFEEAEAALGPIGLLINNAGIAITKPFLDQTPQDWDAVMDVNLRGAWLVGREAARRMRDRGQGGAIVNIASILGERVIPGVAPYNTSKAGLLHLTRSMAVELARWRIRVNALAPGYVETDINRGFFASEAGQAVTKRIPQRRIGQPEDLNGPLLLLASQAGEHMTGAVLVVDGGHSIYSL